MLLPVFFYRLKVLLSIMMVYLTIAGLVTFSLFILEESFQTVMFGTWPAQDAKDWDLVMFGCDRMEDIATTMKVVNYTFGYIQPLAFLSYRQYAKSADYYISGLKAKVFAHSPESFNLRDFEFTFTPKSIIQLDKGVALTNGKIKILVDKRPESLSFQVKGKVYTEGGFVCVDLRRR